MSKSRTVPHPNQTQFFAVFSQQPGRKLLVSADAPNFTVAAVTDSLASALGYTADSMVGRPYVEAFSKSQGASLLGVTSPKKTFTVVVRTLNVLMQEIFRLDAPNPRHPTEKLEHYWRTTLSPIYTEGKAPTHILLEIEDVTSEVTARLELEEARHHLDEALQAGKVGSWTWDIGKDMIIGNAGLAEIFSISTEKSHGGMTTKSFLEYIHPDDKERVVSVMRRAVEHKTTFDTEFRIHSGGKTKWVIGRGRILKRNGVERFSGVTVDVTERRDLQAQIDLARRQDRLNRAEARLLSERNEELQTISRSKDEFVALASHQLRTPATAVKQYIGMVLQGYAGDISDLQSEMLRKAFESNERQIEIINQILNTARVDTGTLAMIMAPVDIAALVRGVTDEMRTGIEKHSHRFLVTLPKHLIIYQADSGYLRMALENIISNADKYTPEGGTIKVELKKVLGAVNLTVKDTGVGIEQKDLGKLFAKFSRIHNQLSVQAGGTGVGLYLASEIVRLHGGSIRVYSKVGQGTTFTITLVEKNEVKHTPVNV